MVTSTVFIGGDVIAARRVLQQELLATTKVIDLNSMAAVTFNDRLAAEETLSALSAIPNIVSASIYKPNGSLFAQYGQADSGGRHSAHLQKMARTRSTQA